MDYIKIYNNIVARGLKRGKLAEYSEKHHIMPRCMGGNDDSSNLVWLTAREHFVAHLLLVKVYPANNKLVHAARMMTRCSNKNATRNNREYEWLKIRYVLLAKQRVGERNGSYGSKWCYNPTTGESTKTKHVPEGWLLGRVPKSKCLLCDNLTETIDQRYCEIHRDAKTVKKETVTCPHCGKTGGKPIMSRFHFGNCKFQQT